MSCRFLATSAGSWPHLWVPGHVCRFLAMSVRSWPCLCVPGQLIFLHPMQPLSLGEAQFMGNMEPFADQNATCHVHD